MNCDQGTDNGARAPPMFVSLKTSAFLTKHKSRFPPVVLDEVLGPSRLATPDSLPSYFCNSVSNTQGEFEAGNSPWGYSSALLVIFR